MGSFGNIKQIRNKTAHHLSGVMLIIIGKRKIFIMVKQFTAHITFHLSSHDMSLTADIIFTECLKNIADK